MPTGGPGVPPLHAAAGVGYGEGFAGNSHRNAPSGFLPAVKYLVEELHADVNAATTRATPRSTTPPRAATTR